MLVFGIILLLLSTAVNNRRDCSILNSRITMLILINTIIILYINTDLNFISGPYSADGLAGGGITLYGGLIGVKNHTMLFAMFILGLSVFIVGLSSFYPRQPNAISGGGLSLNIFNTSEGHASQYAKYLASSPLASIITNKMSDQYRIIEYPLIILFCLTGSIFLIASSDIISVFLAIELQSYGLYLISSIYRNSESSINAGLTYFLLGGLSSCIILLGMSLLYVNTGNTNLDNIYIINNIWNAYSYMPTALIDENIPVDNLWIYQNIYTEYAYMQLPFAIISVGLLFKIAAAPFHFWSPDVYDSIPTIVTTFVAIIAKISLLVLFLELLLYTDNNSMALSPHSPIGLGGGWSNNLIISSIASLIIGSILGLVQHRIKRLYAYSTISHIGFILLALSVNTLESTRAFFFYIIQYSISNLNAFIILITIGYSLFLYSNKYNIKQASPSYGTAWGKYSPIQYISQLKGYFYINPVLAISLAITLFSFIGVPPLIGFFAKQMILSVALDNGYIFATLIAILTSVISAVYYLILVKLIFFDSPIYSINIRFLNFLSSYLPYLSEKNKGWLYPPTTKITSHLSGYTRLGDTQTFFYNKIRISSYLSFSISIFTLFALLFIFFDQEILVIINLCLPV